MKHHTYRLTLPASRPVTVNRNALAYVTERRFNQIIRTLLEVGYSLCAEDEQKILDASDRGTLRFQD